MRLLLVEDDELVSMSLRAALVEQNYVVDVARDGEAGWDYAQSFTYDLMLLDVSLPKLDGISLCRRLRQESNNNPILLLTAKDASEDKVAGLDAGADDYVVKPCTIAELLARIRALLRRRQASGAPILKWGDLYLDPSSREVTYQTKQLALSPTEYSLLELLMRNPKRVFTKSAILEHLWSFDDAPYEDTIRAHIKGLRQKLKKAKAEDLVETVYGVGYRLKPLADTKPAKAEQTLEAVRQVWDKFKAPTLERIATLEEAIAAFQTRQLTTQLLEKAEQQAHKLAGSLGMFGFGKASEIAREIEQALATSSLEANNFPLADLQQFIARLHRELEQLNPQNEASQRYPSADNRAIVLPVSSEPLLLVVDDDLALTQQLQQEALAWNVRVVVAANIPEARNAIAQNFPDLVLLDLGFSNNSTAGLAFLKELKELYPDLPVLVFTAQDEFRHRVTVARLGGGGFLAKPIPPSEVLEIAVEQINRHRSPEMKVLAVDDDPSILQALAQLLSPWGIVLHALADPNQFWETLEATAPDLLILDVEMPHFNGIEICQVVRNDNTWQSLPVVFLSAKSDAETIRQIYQAGADDYIPKPVTEPELVTRIFNRLERTRLLRQIADTDPLTGVANRHCSTRELNRYLRLAQRHKQPVCLAIVDVDRFKQVNDRYGHATGDRILQRLGHILQASFRSEDIVARWGGEEFVLGMYGMDRASAIQRLEELLQKVRDEVFLAEGQQPFHISLSAGVAEYPQQAIDLQKLYLTADAALYQAKNAGRDRVVSLP